VHLVIEAYDDPKDAAKPSILEMVAQFAGKHSMEAIKADDIIKCNRSIE
jgi:hypothetical protein